MSDVTPTPRAGGDGRVPAQTATTDPLTGALQRVELAPTFAAARQGAATVSLLLVDLDHFKSINDAYGHAAGDAVLHEFGVRARAVLRAGDVLVRYGGDEFVVILPHARLTTAHAVAGRLLARIVALPFPGEPPLTVTLSIGCAVVDTDTGELSLAELLARADARLYQAKRRGRNGIVSSDEATPHDLSSITAADEQGRLIERDGDFARMLTWLDALLEGGRGLLRALGAPGVGSTRYLRTVERTARMRGYRVLTLTGSPALRLRQYGALAEALGDGADREALDLQRLLAAVQPADGAGLLLVVDRIGEVDTATLELLFQVVEHPSLARVGLVVGLNLGIADMGRLPDLPVRAEVRLEPFSLAALRVWLRGALLWEAPSEFSAWLHEQTGGYPALLEAAVVQLANDGMLMPIVGKGGWRVSPFIHEYPLRDWLRRARAREEAASLMARPYGQLVGRSAEMRTLTHALAEQRVVALAGPGGVGKTHLALQAAAELGGLFADGVIVAPLAATTAVEFVALALARALGLAVAGRQDPQAVALEYLSARTVLVVFDAVEHLPGIDALVQDLLAAPGVRILITTRDAAIVPAALVITLHGLRAENPNERRDYGSTMPARVTQSSIDIAPSGAALTEPAPFGQTGMGSAHGEPIPEQAAGALFLQASGLTALDAPPTDESLAAIGRVFHLVRGYPLAIKMLARWTAFFSYEEIAERLLRHVLDRTAGADGDDTDPGGSPMQAVFDFFWSLLSAHDRHCMSGLTLFHGGFTAEAALDVAEVTPFLLAALCDRALVRNDGAGRYYLHELLRQYAWGWLEQDAAAKTELERRHAAWCARLAAASATDMRGPRFRQWVDRLEVDLDNLRRALDWAMAHAPLMALDTAVDLTEFWLVGLHSGEGHRWIEMALARAEHSAGELPNVLRLKALGRLGRLERQYGDIGAARERLLAAVMLARAERAPSDRELAYILGTLANIESDEEEHEQAVTLARQALDHARRLGVPENLATTANMAVWPFIFAGARAEATSVVEEGLRASTICGDYRSTANLTNARATIAYYDAARQDEAIALYQRVIDQYEELRDWNGLLLAFNNLASVYVDSNHLDLAAHAFADARRIGRRVKQHRMMPNVLSGSGIVASVRGDDIAAWGFWREALALALASSNKVIVQECTIGLAYAWARGGFAAHAAVLIGMIGLEPVGKPWQLPQIERACAAARPGLSSERWESLVAHGAGLDLSAVARMILARTGPYDVPESILPALAVTARPGQAEPPALP